MAANLDGGLWLTVSDRAEGPVTVVGHASPAPDHPRGAAARRSLLVAIWGGLIVAVGLCLAADGEFGAHDMIVTGMVCVAGWPVTFCIVRVAHAPEASAARGGEVEPPTPHPSDKWPPTVVLRDGTVVDPTLGKILADLVGVRFVEPPAG